MKRRPPARRTATLVRSQRAAIQNTHVTSTAETTWVVRLLAGSWELMKAPLFKNPRITPPSSTSAEKNSGKRRSSTVTVSPPRGRGSWAGRSGSALSAAVPDAAGPVTISRKPSTSRTPAASGPSATRGLSAPFTKAPAVEGRRLAKRASTTAHMMGVRLWAARAPPHTGTMTTAHRANPTQTAAVPTTPVPSTPPNRTNAPAIRVAAAETPTTRRGSLRYMRADGWRLPSESHTHAPMQASPKKRK